MQNLNTILTKCYNNFKEAYEEDSKGDKFFKFKYLSPDYWLLFQQYKEYIKLSKMHKPPLFAYYYSQLQENIRKILDD